MQCSRCGMVVPDQTPYCYGCGLSLSEATQPALQPAVATQQVVNETPVFLAPPPPPSMEAGWAEFSGTQAPAGAWSPYPPVSPAPGGYVYPNNYPYAPGMTPPPVMPAPKRQGLSLAVIMILSALVLLLVFGGVFIGVRMGQANNGVPSAQATATTNATPDANQLYQQITSQKPAFADTLHNGSLSSWAVYEKPTYGCELAADGLHVHIKDAGHFGLCSSGRGKFSNFAFQIDMDILAGEGGGITFRSDSLGNMYYFHVYPSGNYHIYTEQANKPGTELGSGVISSYVSGFNQKNTLTVIAQGSNLYFYVNQKYVTIVHDSTYTNGYLGVLADDHTAQAEVVYTNMQIWTL